MRRDVKEALGKAVSLFSATDVDFRIHNVAYELLKMTDEQCWGVFFALRYFVICQGRDINKIIIEFLIIYFDDENHIKTKQSLFLDTWITRERALKIGWALVVPLLVPPDNDVAYDIPLKSIGGA
ncbi:hypothetical protein QJS10_CPB17g02463 [Acorus calamus]|uniref:Uncharacterized protein n=1 Tax=Acorus calamus TaxID=4465 RepID=A0AAV9CXE9_ACOCL|nr:hypothetical protein QJS10_CPB17g02463 [Acorus calamus]